VSARSLQPLVEQAPRAPRIATWPDGLADWSDVRRRLRNGLMRWMSRSRRLIAPRTFSKKNRRTAVHSANACYTFSLCKWSKTACGTSERWQLRD